jgi:hypothetical protein
MLARHAVLLTEHAAKHAHPACPGLAGERASRADGTFRPCRKGSPLVASLPSRARLALAFSPTDRSSNSFRCNTYGFPRKCCKQKTYDRPKPFSCNTYKKHGGRGSHLLSIANPALYFLPLTNCKFRNSFVLTFIQNARGVTPFKPKAFQQSRGIPIPFFALHTLLRNGASATPAESIRCALFPSRRGCTPFSRIFPRPEALLAARRTMIPASMPPLERRRGPASLRRPALQSENLGKGGGAVADRNTMRANVLRIEGSRDG